MNPAGYAELSNVAVMLAAVLYTLAFLAHVTEWSLTREAAATEQRGPRRQRVEFFCRLGISLTCFAFVFHVGGVVLRGLAASRVPWGNMYEFTLTGCAAAVGTYLLLLRLRPIRWLGLPMAAVAVVMLMLAVLVLDVPAGPLVPALQSYWLYIHVSAALLATGAFTVGALASVLFLVRHRAEERGTASSGLSARLPDSETIDRYADRLHAFAFPVWTFAALVAGPIWARYAWGRYWGWDPKEVWAFITWVAYAGYLHARATAGWRGRRAAVLALVGFATLWFNFIGVNFFISGLHSYAGK